VGPHPVAGAVQEPGPPVRQHGRAGPRRRVRGRRSARRPARDSGCRPEQGARRSRPPGRFAWRAVVGTAGGDGPAAGDGAGVVDVCDGRVRRPGDRPVGRFGARPAPAGMSACWHAGSTAGRRGNRPGWRR
jgi:hypothetical protein